MNTIPSLDRWRTYNPSARQLRLFAAACARHTPGLDLPPVNVQAVDVAEKFADGKATVEELRRARIDCHEEDSYPWHGIDIAMLAARPQDSDMAYDDVVEWLTNTPACPIAALLACIAGPCECVCPECKGRGWKTGRHTPGAPAPNCSTCNGSGYVAAPLPTLCGRRHAAIVDDLPYLNFGAEECVDCRPILARNRGAVRNIAHTIYEDRTWHELPVLAEALEEADCTSEAVLSHLRADGGECEWCEGEGCNRGDMPDSRWNGCNNGRLPAIHSRGCWVLELIRGVEP